MAISYVGLCGAVLNFGGGVFLVWDALRVRRQTLAHFGAKQTAEEEAERTKQPPRYETADGQPLASELDWELWLAQRALKWTWVGFALIAAGFLLDICSRIVSAAS
jgi:hypothetical protein